MIDDFGNVLEGETYSSSKKIKFFSHITFFTCFKFLFARHSFCNILSNCEWLLWINKALKHVHLLVGVALLRLTKIHKKTIQF